VGVDGECRVDIERPRPGVACVVVAGACDLMSVPQIRSALDEVLAERSRWVEVDLSAVTFLDAAGLHELVWAADHITRADGQLVITHPAPVARRVLEATGLDGLSIGENSFACRADEPA
jgi:anti-anti-sigma factor